MDKPRSKTVNVKSGYKPLEDEQVLDIREDSVIVSEKKGFGEEEEQEDDITERNDDFAGTRKT